MTKADAKIRIVNLTVARPIVVCRFCNNARLPSNSFHDRGSWTVRSRWLAMPGKFYSEDARLAQPREGFIRA
jgi:hypothetical protein